jgi:hypothetical protein
MAGGWGIVPPIRVGGVSATADAGWYSPIPTLNLGAKPAFKLAPIPLWIWGTNRPGWISPVPVLNLGALSTVGGFFSAIPVVPYAADGAVVVDEGGRKRRTYFTMLGRTRLGR